VDGIVHFAAVGGDRGGEAKAEADRFGADVDDVARDVVAKLQMVSHVQPSRLGGVPHEARAGHGAINREQDLFGADLQHHDFQVISQHHGLIAVAGQDEHADLPIA